MCESGACALTLSAIDRVRVYLGAVGFDDGQQACDAFCVPEQHTDPEFNDGSHSECFDANGLQIADCECHDTCSMCGYSDEPTRALDCVQCKDGLTLTVLNKENTGTCSSPMKPQCFAEPGGDPIPGCACHGSCGACGYGPNPVNAFDCISCLDGDHYPLFPNGTGACVQDLDFKAQCFPLPGGMWRNPNQVIPDCEVRHTTLTRPSHTLTTHPPSCRTQRSSSRRGAFFPNEALVLCLLPPSCSG